MESENKMAASSLNLPLYPGHVLRMMLLVTTISLMTSLLPVSGFGYGTQIQANFGLYCNRPASQRYPIHNDVRVCRGLCVPKEDTSNMFSIRVNATSYFSDTVEVSVTADSGKEFSNNIRGFAVVAMTEDELIVGGFAEKRGTLIASCDPLTEGATAFHDRASLNRRNLTLSWEPGSKNYGRVRFRAWIVVQHNDVYVLDSKSIDSELTGSVKFAVKDNFFTFILQVFNISRSAARVLDEQSHTGDKESVADDKKSNANGTDSHTDDKESDADDKESDASGTDSHTDDKELDANGTDSHTDDKESNANGTDSHTDDKESNVNGTDSHTHDKKSDADGKEFNANGTDSHTHDKESGAEDDHIGMTSLEVRTALASNFSLDMQPGDNKTAILNNLDNRNDTDTVAVVVQLTNGESIRLEIPSLESFEKAFNQRLFTTGFDLNAEDPFQQLTREVPTFRDLFPEALPHSDSTLSLQQDASDNNPFFQSFGSSNDPVSSSQDGGTSATARLRQSLSQLSNTSQRGDSLASRRNHNSDPSAGNLFANQFAQLPSIGNAFPFSTSSSSSFQLPASAGGFSRNQFGQQINSGNGLPFPSGVNVPQSFFAANGLTGSQFGQQGGTGNSQGFLTSSDVFQRPTTSRDINSQWPSFSRFQGNVPSSMETVNAQLGFPTSSSFLGRILQTSSSLPGNVNPNNAFSSMPGNVNPNNAFSSMPGNVNPNNAFSSMPGNVNPNNAFSSNLPNFGFSALGQQNSGNFFTGQQLSGNSFFSQGNSGGNIFGQQNNFGNNLLQQQLSGIPAGQQFPTDGQFWQQSNSNNGNPSNTAIFQGNGGLSIPNSAPFLESLQQSLNSLSPTGNQIGNTGLQPSFGSPGAPTPRNMPNSPALSFGGGQQNWLG